MNTKAQHETAAGAPEAPQQPGTADINTALARDKAYTRKLYAETQQIIDKRKPQAQQSPQIAIGKVDGEFVDQNGFYLHDRSDYEQTKREIVRRYNSADKLAEQLGRLERIARDTIGADGALLMACDNAKAALAAWEKEGK